MSFVLRPDHSLARGLSLVATTELARALETARDGTIPVMERIHGARTGCKKVRGLLRMAASGFPAFHEENAAIRDAASTLSRARDHAVMAETLAKLLPRIGQLGKAEEARLHAAIAAAAITDRESEAILQQFIADIEPVQVRSMLWHTTGLGWDSAVEGTGKTYSRARRSWNRATETARPDDFHSSRKQVKYHWYQLVLLRKFAPDGFATRRRKAKELGALLGEHHDLEVLLDHLAHTISDDLDLLTRADVQGRRRQVRLAAKARRLADDLFNDSAKAWRRRIAELVERSGAPGRTQTTEAGHGSRD